MTRADPAKVPRERHGRREARTASPAPSGVMTSAASTSFRRIRREALERRQHACSTASFIARPTVDSAADTARSARKSTSHGPASARGRIKDRRNRDVEPGLIGNFAVLGMIEGALEIIQIRADVDPSGKPFRAVSRVANAGCATLNVGKRRERKVDFRDASRLRGRCESSTGNRARDRRDRPDSRNVVFGSIAETTAPRRNSAARQRLRRPRGRRFDDDPLDRRAGLNLCTRRRAPLRPSPVVKAPGPPRTCAACHRRAFA